MRNRKDDYRSAKIAQEGLAKIGKIISKKLNENKIPKDPIERIRLAEQMKREEDIFHKARKAEAEIINIRKARKGRAEYKREADKAWREYRREKFRANVKSVWQGIKDVHR